MTENLNSEEQQIPERVPYQFEVVDWKIVSSIEIVQAERKDPIEVPFIDTTNLILMCKLNSPKIKGICQCKVNLFSEPKMENRPYKPDNDVFYKVLGGMLINEANLLTLGCTIPPRMAFQVQVAVAMGKINHIQVYGSQLTNQHAWIYDITLFNTFN